MRSLSSEKIECPLCAGAGELSRAEILDRLGVRDFARVAQLSAEEDSHEDRAFVQCVEDAIQRERHFAEPTNVRANRTAALASGKLDWRIVSICVAKGCATAPVAAALEEFAVHVDDALRPCLLVKIVHILSAEEEAILQPLLQLRESEVRRIRLGFLRDPTSHGIELPN